MRKLILIVLLAALLYGGYWFVGRAQVETRLVEALEQIDAGPQDLSYETLGTRGFPSRFDTTVTNLRFSDPTSAVIWSAPMFQLFAMSYRPNEVIAVFPNEQTLTLQDEVFTLFTNDMRASGKVSANTALSFQNATITMDNPRIRTNEGAELAMASLLAAMRLAPDQAQTYDIFFEARSIVLPEDIRRLLDPGNLQPPIVQNLRLDAKADLTSAIALNTANTAPPEIAGLAITEFELAWGEMSVTAIGDLTPTDAGLLNGSVTFTARNWQQAIDLGVANGMINEDRRFLIIGIASSMDETPDFPDTLTLTLQIIDGTMRIGGLDLGPAPVLR